MLVGREMTVDEVTNEVMRDKVFYDKSGGGVTLSGGDPVVQHSFSKALLKRCKAEGLHTAYRDRGKFPVANLGFVASRD